MTDLEVAESKFNNDTLKVSAEIAKWYKNHKAALSITNDAGSVAIEPEIIVQKLVEDNKLKISYEFVTDAYINDFIRLNYFLNSYLAKGFGYYGHGHTHINHDRLTEE